LFCFLLIAVNKNYTSKYNQTTYSKKYTKEWCRTRWFCNSKSNRWSF